MRFTAPFQRDVAIMHRAAGFYNLVYDSSRWWTDLAIYLASLSFFPFWYFLLFEFPSFSEFPFFIRPFFFQLQQRTKDLFFLLLFSILPRLNVKRVMWGESVISECNTRIRKCTRMHQNLDNGQGERTFRISSDHIQAS